MLVLLQISVFLSTAPSELARGDSMPTHFPTALSPLPHLVYLGVGG